MGRVIASCQFCCVLLPAKSSDLPFHASSTLFNMVNAQSGARGPVPSVHGVLCINVDPALAIVQHGLEVADGGHLMQIVDSIR